LKKMLKPVSCSLVAIFALSVAVANPKMGHFGVDSVSAATGVTPTTPTKTTLPAKVITYTTPTSITRILKINSMGADVKFLQTCLNNNGYKLNADGIFGKLTLAEVKNYQSKNGLVIDGIVGPKTLAKLNFVVVKPAVPTVPTVPTIPVTPPVVDVVTAASLVDNAAVFEKSIGKDGKWIICITKDVTSTKNLVLEGKLLNTKIDPITGLGAPQRKIALYAQDDKHVVTERYTLTAPKLTITSPEARIQGGTFKGNVYVNSRNFLLTDAKIIGDVYVHSTEFNLTKDAVITGNVYFDNIEAQKTFVIDASSSVKGNQILLQTPVTLDSVASASLVDNGANFEKAISKDGTWIICPVKDMVINKELVLEGNLTKLDSKAVPPAQVATGRKIGLYYHDGDNYTTARFTLKAPKLTIKSKDSSMQKGTFVGDLYVSATKFKLTETRIEGNVYVTEAGFKLATGSKIVGNLYFATQALKDAFDLDTTSIDATSLVTGTKTVKAN